MLKRNICRLATILCGLIALTISSRFRLISWPWLATQSVGLVPGLLSAIFATQWIHYQKQVDEASDQPRWPAWLRRMLY